MEPDENLTELGVDSGLMAFVPVEMEEGEHILVGTNGNGRVLAVRPGTWSVCALIDDTGGSWGRRVWWVEVQEGEAPEALVTLEVRTERLLVADPCYVHEDEDMLPGEPAWSLGFWGRDADEAAGQMAQAGVQAIKTADVWRVQCGSEEAAARAGSNLCELRIAGMRVEGWPRNDRNVYTLACDAARPIGLYESLHGQAVCSRAGFGDGGYDLHVERQEGRVVRARVTFIRPEDV